MRDKTKRLRGSGSHGRGWRKSRHKGGSKGGVGNAGSKTHKRFTTILQKKKLEASRKATCIRDLESKMQRYIRKGYFLKKLVDKEEHYMATEKFYKKYNKILSTGEPSYNYKFDLRRISLSKIAALKLQ